MGVFRFFRHLIKKYKYFYTFLKEQSNKNINQQKPIIQKRFD